MNRFEIDPGGFSVYGWITIFGLVVGAWFWLRRWRKTPETFGIYIGALCGAFLGAKLLFIAAEGWMNVRDNSGWNALLQLLAGKTIVGALLGGYAGVEIAKKIIGYKKPTGDWFAVGVPLGIAMGRIGCLRYGCCLGNVCSSEQWWTMADSLGDPRWPASVVEMISNLLFVAAMLPIVTRGAGKGQLFHVYLICYGLFRFFHEFFRDTPDLIGSISGYQIAALGLVALGAIRAWQRAKSGGQNLDRAEEYPPADGAREAK
ncbi:MAG: diacylglyceryl transferase [Verrucomicrobiales bacterium]|nr:diacylglyceryl transferase [Verrucomicrobiales bacterium]